MRKSLVGALVGALVAAPLAGVALSSGASAAVTTEGFDIVAPAGWTIANNSNAVGSTSVFQGTPVAGGGPFDAQGGAANSYAGMNYNSTGSTGTISTWLVTPTYASLSSGDVMSFYTRKPDGPDYPDRLEVRMSTNGSCSPGTGWASVGDFTTVLTTINPTLVAGGYPMAWTQFTITLSGVSGTASGCFAFRYFVTNGGNLGTNSDFIGIDTYAYNDQPTDVTAPDTSITSGPATGTSTSDTTPTFGFDSSEPGSTFQCRVDSSAFASCNSPITTGSLAEGPHTFEVRATDSVGNTDATPASSDFSVDTVAPDTTITSGPATGTSTSDTTPTFGFGSSEPGSTFQCRVDSSAFAPCGSPVTTVALALGAHTFEVRATDGAANTDATPATSSFGVVAPSTDCSTYSAAVATATAAVAKAKAKLKKAKRSGNARALKKAKANVRKAKKELKAASEALATCQAG